MSASDTRLEAADCLRIAGQIHNTQGDQENSSTVQDTKLSTILHAVAQDNQTLPYRHAIKSLAKTLFVDEWDTVNDKLGEEAWKELVSAGVAHSSGSKSIYYNFDETQFRLFLKNKDLKKKVEYQAVICRFEYDTNPEKTMLEHSKGKDKRPSNAAVVWCSGPSNIPHWWAAAGSVSESFSMRYGLGHEWTWRRVPYVFLRDIVYAIRDLIEFLLIAPGRWQAFQKYLEDPTPHHLAEMMKSGVTIAFFNLLIDTAMRLFIYNRGKTTENIAAFLRKPSPQHFMDIMAQYPGLLTGLFLTITWVTVEAGQFLIYNPKAEDEYKKCLQSLTLSNLRDLLLRNPGVAGFLAMATGYGMKRCVETLIYNHTARDQYAHFYKQASVTHIKELVKSNPGVLGFVSVVVLKTLRELSLNAFRVLVYNDRAIEKNKENSIRNFWGEYTWTSYGQMIIGDWRGPGLVNAIAAGTILLFKMWVLNPEQPSLEAYGAFYKKVSWKHIKELVQSNPGVLGFVSVVVLKTLRELSVNTFRVLVYNDRARSTSPHFWDQYTWSSYGQMIIGDWRGPGLVNAVAGFAVLTFQMVIWNPKAKSAYSQFWQERSMTNFGQLWVQNPGAVGALGCAFTAFLETGARLFLWNPQFAAKDFMFGSEGGKGTLKSINMYVDPQSQRHFGLALEKWPGLIYGMVLLATKYGIINPSAHQEYIDAIRAVGGRTETQKLVLKSPGCVAFVAFVALKLVEEIGFHVLVDPRQLDAYLAYSDQPSWATAKDLFASGVIGAAFCAIGVAIARGGRMAHAGVASILDS